MSETPEVIFSDRLLTEAEAAKRAGMALKTFRELPASDRPWTLWADDVARWANRRKLTALNAGRSR